MVHGLIDPDLFMPGSKHLRPAAVRESVAELRRLGAGVSERTWAVYEAWAGLSVHYQAPEQEKVLSLMVPAQTAGDDVAQAMRTVATALEAYADELVPIRKDMLSLEGRARAFRSRAVSGAAIEGTGDAWFESLVAAQQDNDRLLNEYAALLGRVSQAVATCADTVNRVAYPVTCTAPTSVFTAEQVMALDVLPWGPPSDEKDRSVLAQLNEGVRHDFLGSFAAMFGYDSRTERFSRATAGQAWGGGADLVVSVLAMGIPVTGVPNATRKPREWVEGQTGWNVSGGTFDRWLGDRQKVVTDAGGSLVGYDPGEGWLWDDQPVRAGSATLLNLATIAVPAARVGAGAKAAGVGSKTGTMVSGAARTGAEAMLPGASWVVHGAQAVTRGASTLVRTGSWTAAVDAFRTFVGGPGLGRTRAGVAQALADLDKISPPVGQNPHLPTVSESIARSSTEPNGSVARQESWLYQDPPVEPSAAQRAADTPVREPALVGADRPGTPSAWHSGGNDPTGAAPGRAADAVTTQPISGLPRPSEVSAVPGGPGADGSAGPRQPSHTPSDPQPGAWDPSDPKVETVPGSQAPVGYGLDDVARAWDDAPVDAQGRHVDHRTGEPLIETRADGSRGWHMVWDPDGQRWMAERPGAGYPDGMPEHGEPGSYGYDEHGNLLPYANNRPEYAPGQVEEVWKRASPAWEKAPDGTWHRVEGVRDAVEVRDINGNKYWIDWDPEAGGPRNWDMGHLRGREYRRLRERYLAGGLSKDEFLERYWNPDNYSVQDPVRNRSHVDELP